MQKFSVLFSTSGHFFIFILGAVGGLQDRRKIGKILMPNKKLAGQICLRRAIGVLNSVERSCYAAAAISGSSMFAVLALPARGSNVRNFMRALWSCDLLFPIEQPSISAISLCS